MAKHALPRSRAPFWTIAAGAVAATAIVSGTLFGLAPHVQGEPHAAAQATVWEDSPGFNCTTMGNDICGPGNSEGLPAGCYGTLEDSGTLLVPWTRYDVPQADPLWAQLNASGNCWDIPGVLARYGGGNGAACDTDAHCAAYSREVLGEEPTGYAAGK